MAQPLYKTDKVSASSDMRTSHCDYVAIPRDDSLAELSCCYVLLREEDIKLFESSCPSFGKSEVSPDK